MCGFLVGRQAILGVFIQLNGYVCALLMTTTRGQNAAVQCFATLEGMVDSPCTCRPQEN